MNAGEHGYSLGDLPAVLLVRSGHPLWQRSCDRAACLRVQVPPTASQAERSGSHSGEVEQIAERYPQYSTQIIEGAKSSFLAGADWAYTAGIIAIVVGAAIVYFLFPKKDRELQLLASYNAEDTNQMPATAGQIKPAPEGED
jgi:hypothetical protein